MKWVVAIVRPNRLEVVKDLLGKQGFHGLTVTDVQGVGRQRGHTEVYRGHEYKVDLISKVKLEVAVPDENVDRFVELVARAARTGEEGQIGDGKIFVLPLEDAVRIRTGESGDAAL
jgi:nitrogen regulatory protein P-II 1